VNRWPALTGRTGLVLALAMVATCSLVGSSDAATAVPGSDPQAQALLQRAVEAEDATTYQGVEYLSVADDDDADDPDSSGDSGGTATAEVVDVTHLPGQGTVLVEDADDGTPERAAFSAASTGADASRPNLLLGLLSRSYQLVLGPGAVVAGRYTSQVVARRSDGTVAARFWIDSSTGLLLRRDTLGPTGVLVRRSEFVQLALTAASPRHLPVMLPAPTGRAMSDDDLGSWRDRGWPCPRVLGGLSLFDARTVPDGGAAILHLSYSDGLSTVSVFVQPGHLAAPAGSTALAGTTAARIGGQPVLVRAGEPREIVWSSDGYVITVVADAPADTVAAVVAGLPHATPAAGAWSRVERGVARVVSWFNPFA
jgi:sigma-E factor negative regulatory protein RseB